MSTGCSTRLTAGIESPDDMWEIITSAMSVGEVVEYREAVCRQLITVDLPMPFGRAYIALVTALARHTNGMHIHTHGESNGTV